MARAPRAGTVRFQGTRGGKNLSFTYETGPELKRFMQQGRTLFTTLQGPINEAHWDIGYTVVKNVHQVLRERMRAHRPRRPGRAQGKLRATLDRDLSVSPPWKLTPASHAVPGVHIDWAEELDKRVTDEKQRPYWRSVEYGFTLNARGHLFRTRGGALVGPMRGISNRALGMIGGGDPRMPKVGVQTEFTAEFGGYFFIRDGMKRAGSELSRRLNPRAVDNPYRLAFIHMPDEMMAVMDYYVGGGTGRRPQKPAGGGFMKDPRGQYPRHGG